MIKEQVDSLLRQRKLPIVLDLDDTLVRAIGDAPGRYVPGSQVHLAEGRVWDLKDCRRIVVATRVFEFLQWASKIYDISVCSLGEQSYVEQVVSVLNSQTRNCIRVGASYSARGEYLYLSQFATHRPPKDLNSLFAFYSLNQDNVPKIEPLILDDNAGMWPADQQDNIIVVKELQNAAVWDVSLFPSVQQALKYVHENFFRYLDAWAVADPKRRGAPPNPLVFYKEYLRKEFANQISSGN